MLTMIHGHWAYCPSGSVTGHAWLMTGGVTLRDLLGVVLLARYGLRSN